MLIEDKAVLEMANNESVVERPEDQRYYQVPGHEYLMLNVAGNRIANKDLSYLPKSGSLDDFYIGFSYLIEHLLYDETVPVVSKNPSADWLQSVYADYGKSKTLWDIFFCKDEGNIEPPMNYSDNIKFITNNESSTDTRILGFFTEFIDKFCLIDNNSANSEQQLINEAHYIPDDPRKG